MFQTLRNYIRRSELLSEARRWMLYHGRAAAEPAPYSARDKEAIKRDFYIKKVAQLSVAGLSEIQLDAIEMDMEQKDLSVLLSSSYVDQLQSDPEQVKRQNSIHQQLVDQITESS